MKSADDGGPAFPRHQLESVYDDHAPGGRREALVSYAGMELRDYFAAKVAPAVCEKFLTVATDHPDLKAAVAEWSYEIADAMIAQRKKLVP